MKKIQKNKGEKKEIEIYLPLHPLGQGKTGNMHSKKLTQHLAGQILESGMPRDLNNGCAQTWALTGGSSGGSSLRGEEGLAPSEGKPAFPFIPRTRLCGMCTELKRKNIKHYLWSCNFWLSGNKFCQQITTRQKHTQVHCNKAHEVLTRLQSLESLVLKTATTLQSIYPQS